MKPTKTLLLLRHAKSSWDDPELEDHDRPLNTRGRKAASRMGRLLEDERIPIELVICSSAVRTRETVSLLFSKQKDLPTIIYDERLYHATPHEILQVLHDVPDLKSCVMLIGHNPGFEEFVMEFTGLTLHFPTAALALIRFNVDRWSALSNATLGRLEQFWRPKELDR